MLIWDDEKNQVPRLSSLNIWGSNKHSADSNWSPGWEISLGEVSPLFLMLSQNVSKIIHPWVLAEMAY